jgi:hypothetical protein
MKEILAKFLTDKSVRNSYALAAYVPTVVQAGSPWL